MAVLNIVSTPIGNLKDITLRAIEVLSDSEVLYCEDTRVTRKLLSHLKISTTGKKLVSINKINEASRIDEIISDLKDEKTVSLVVDAGTPLISDPGNFTVSKILEFGYRVISVPGPSSVISALTVSGFNTERFYFQGFLPKKLAEKQKVLEKITNMDCTTVFFESPYRLEDTIKIVTQMVDNNRKICIVKELTKLNESVLVDTASKINEELQKTVIKGEYVILISPNTKAELINDEDAITLYKKCLESGMDSKDSLVYVSKQLNLKKNHLYRILKIQSQVS